MKLGVNVDHTATLRQARRSKEPDPVHAAVLAEKAGCDSIVAHLREDRRHVNDRDIKLLREIVNTKFNLEMSLADEIVKIALEVKPDEVTIVPERREEVTTEGGLDVVRYKKKLQEVIPQFHARGIKVSLFVDPDLNQIKTAGEVSADYIEIHTGMYAHAYEKGDYQEQLQNIIEAVEFGIKAGLGVNAGHGLNYKNVIEIAKIRGIETLNIGHSIISRAVFVGLEQAVKEMLELIR
ncbi:MAG: pyridoxine 5'-phosphate synthase [Candidatus Omnitrophota bacterium]|nr:MAG: pyridoxine 5'-phosphate synthase [Candidatus Omnitrophota bacterium]